MAAPGPFARSTDGHLSRYSCARIIGNSSPRLTDVFSDLCYHVSYLAIITIVE